MSEAWIDELRRACEATSQRQVARRIGYTAPVVSQILRGVYPSDMARVRTAVEGALMQREVECPVLGTISRERCIAHQRRPFTPSNPATVRLYRACRSGCPHSMIGTERAREQ